MAIIKVFLDDKRMPADMVICGARHNRIYATEGWLTFTNCKSFENYLHQSTLPDIISFDHDLCAEHVSAIAEIDKFSNSNLSYIENQIYNKFTVGCGYHAAKFLVMHCIQMGYELPLCFVHSANNNAVRNIFAALEQYDTKKRNLEQQKWADRSNGFYYNGD